MAIGVNEYRKKLYAEKEITLPSGAVFKIKKLTGRDFLKYGELPLKSTMEIARANDKENAVVNTSENERKKLIEAMDRIICLAVVEPKISLEKKEGYLHIDELVDEDYYALVDEISKFSFGGGGENLRPFRPQQSSIIAGYNGEEVSGSTSSDIGSKN